MTHRFCRPRDAWVMPETAKTGANRAAMRYERKRRVNEDLTGKRLVHAVCSGFGVSVSVVSACFSRARDAWVRAQSVAAEAWVEALR